jgi:hypothetical protein
MTAIPLVPVKVRFPLLSMLAIAVLELFHVKPDVTSSASPFEYTLYILICCELDEKIYPCHSKNIVNLCRCS